MKRVIKKAVVLGSGIMGSRIACHLANIGLDVLLLDIVPSNTNQTESSENNNYQRAKLRNQIVNDSLRAAIKSKPSPLYDTKDSKLIKTGNFEDDLPKIKDYDWVIEAIVEKLDIKQSLFEKVEKYRKPGTLITTNTSGIPIHMMIKGRSEDFQLHFCGTHFFNPPRYLKLLEIIPSPKTKPEIVDFFLDYGELYLGKDTVLCKDTPAFIANRIGVYSMSSGMHGITDTNFSVSEIDKLTGTIIGRAKSATFRTSDLVGLDTMVNVSKNLLSTLKNDESIDKFNIPKVVEKLTAKGWLGDKTKQGFYKKSITKEGKKEILELNLKSLAYETKKKSKIDVLNKTKNIENLKERLRICIREEGNIGHFYKTTFFDLFRYCTYRIPEISEELYRIDQAVSGGFAWEMGPFESWDAMGTQYIYDEMQKNGYTCAAWVKEMLDGGHLSFYQFQKGQKYYYDLTSKNYKVIPGSEKFLYLDAFKSEGIVWNNSGATLYDIGDGVLNLEFHTKMNAIDVEVVESIAVAIEKAEKEHLGIVIGNEGQNFSAGANLAMVFMHAADQEFDEIDMMIKGFQDVVARCRFSGIPIVAATSGLTLGGGCEISMHCDSIQAHAETYIGLVEVGVGLIPGGGGTKEFALRAADDFTTGDIEINTLQEYFTAIATAKVATSAKEAKGLRILRKGDRITINRQRLIADAKMRVLELHNNGYTQPVPRNDIKVQGRTGLATLMAGVAGMKYAAYASDHDVKIANKVAWIMNGGDLSAPSLVSEQYLLDLEREAFLSLCGEPKSLERIQSILFKGRPLRN